MTVSSEQAVISAPRHRTRTSNSPPIPDFGRLPDSAYITRTQLSLVTGIAVETYKGWDYGRAGKGAYAGQQKGPIVVRIEGLPRYRIGDVKAWLAGTVAAK